MAQVNIRMDDQLKEQGEKLFKSMGMTLSTALNIFVTQAVNEQAIPFKITAPADPFYSESNMKAMHESIAQFDTPDSPKIIKTIEELRAMEDE